MTDIQLTGDFATQFFDRMITGLSDASLEGILAFTGKAVGVAAESVVSEYPAPSGKPLEKYYTRTNAKGESYQSKFKSIRQQKFVMALVGRGGVPYRRTGQLGKSITSSIRDLSPTSVTAVVGTNYPAAKYVIGTEEEGQSKYHAGNWTPLQDDISQNLGKITAVGQAAFSKAVRAALL